MRGTKPDSNLYILMFAVGRVTNVSPTEDIDVQRCSIVRGNCEKCHHQNHIGIVTGNK